jgi:hypothetical protein
MPVRIVGVSTGFATGPEANRGMLFALSTIRDAFSRMEFGRVEADQSLLEGQFYGSPTKFQSQDLLEDSCR